MTLLISVEMPSLQEQCRGYTIDQLLQAMEANAPGTTNRLYLESLLSVRTAEMVNRQLSERARVTVESAALIRESIGNLTKALQQSSGFGCVSHRGIAS